MISHQNACAKLVQQLVFDRDNVQLRWAFVKKALKADVKTAKRYPTKDDIELMFIKREPEVVSEGVIVIDSLNTCIDVFPETTKLVQSAWQMR